MFVYPLTFVLCSGNEQPAMDYAYNVRRTAAPCRLHSDRRGQRVSAAPRRRRDRPVLRALRRQGDASRGDVGRVRRARQGGQDPDLTMRWDNYQAPPRRVTFRTPYDECGRKTTRLPFPADDPPSFSGRRPAFLFRQRKRETTHRVGRGKAPSSIYAPKSVRDFHGSIFHMKVDFLWMAIPFSFICMKLSYERKQ